MIVECAKYKIEIFTVREIFKVASVNLSAVNYYFRSTNNLLNEVEVYFAEKVQEISSILEKEYSS